MTQTTLNTGSQGVQTMIPSQNKHNQFINHKDNNANFKIIIIVIPTNLTYAVHGNIDTFQFSILSMFLLTFVL